VALCDPHFASALIGSLRSGLVAIDENGRLVALNAGAQRILGCPGGPPDAALGRDCREALGPQPTVSRLLLEALDGHERPTRAELVLEAQGSSAPRTIGFTLGAMRDDAGVLRGAALFFRDLTPVERSSEQERLHERLAALGQMAAGLAHEIRNPLAGMEVIAGLLRRRLEGRAEDLALLGELTGELRALAATVTQSLEFVRPLVPVHTRLDAATLVEEALTTALTRVPGPVAIEREYEPGLPPLLGDAEQLRTVLVNLLVNALEAMQAMPAGARRLHLAARSEAAERSLAGQTWAVRSKDRNTPPCSPPQRALVLEVDDTGPGVPADLRERIFYPFFTTKERGSGLGLAMAQKIVASHSGNLSLELGTGPGGHFRVRLPLEGARAAEYSSSTAAEQRIEKADLRAGARR
jgi:nitrogen-specific signal transduction histidine kinase